MECEKNNPEAEAFIVLVASYALFCHIANAKSAVMVCQALCVASWITVSQKHQSGGRTFAYLVCQ